MSVFEPAESHNLMVLDGKIFEVTWEELHGSLKSSDMHTNILSYSLSCVPVFQTLIVVSS